VGLHGGPQPAEPTPPTLTRSDLPICSLDRSSALRQAAHVLPAARPLLLLFAIGVVAACDSNVAPADAGVRYTFVNRCDETLVIEMASGSDPIVLTPDESGTMRSLDETPDETFIVRRPDGTGELRFAPGSVRFDIVAPDCPT